jgi:GNAT superfamily N-acetyltransferase
VFTIRLARADDAGPVSAIALRSKGHWGYSAEFLEACRAELTYSEADCRSGDLYVAEADSVVAGFLLLRGAAPDGDLQAMFVDPPWIGQGLGGVLIAHALELARSRGITRVDVESDPGAEPFYLHHGARRVGEVASGSVPGRVLPLLVFDLDPGAATATH